MQNPHQIITKKSSERYNKNNSEALAVTFKYKKRREIRKPTVTLVAARCGLSLFRVKHNFFGGYVGRLYGHDAQLWGPLLRWRHATKYK